jgi:hypothetical protein
MKNLILNYLVFGLILLASFVVNDTEDILTLQKNGDIELTIKGNSGSTHYLEPLMVNVENKTKKIIEMKVPAGLHFVSIEDNIQDIISTQAQLVRVAPNSNKNFTISGVCIQATNGSPGSTHEFKLTANAEPKLHELAQFLDKKNIKNSQAQQAAWAISDNRDISNIIGLDMENEQELIDKTASILGLPSVPAEDIKAWKKERINPVYTSSLKGYFKFEFPRKTKVQIALFNQDNVLIKEVFNQQVDAGFHKIDYRLETTEYEGQKIISQMIAYNKVVSKRSIDLRH